VQSNGDGFILSVFLKKLNGEITEQFYSADPEARALFGCRFNIAQRIKLIAKSKAGS